MFEKVSIPILGLVENRAPHLCPNCGHECNIFGEGAPRGWRPIQGRGARPVPPDIRIREQATPATRPWSPSRSRAWPRLPEHRPPLCHQDRRKAAGPLCAFPKIACRRPEALPPGRATSTSCSAARSRNKQR
jgi:hypothetical protein